MKPLSDSLIKMKALKLNIKLDDNESFKAFTDN